MKGIEHMVHLNDNAIAYMNKRGFRNIILSIRNNHQLMCPSRLEISVGFTDKEKRTCSHRGMSARPVLLEMSIICLMGLL